jgi:hypothetical protein
MYSAGGNWGSLHNWDCWNDPNMVYVLDDAGGGRFRLRHEMSNQCTYAHATNGDGAHHWSCWSDPNMAFELVPFLGGYRLRHHMTNQSLYGHESNGGKIHNWSDWGDINMVYFVDVIGWTDWLNRDNPSGSGDWETRTSFPSGTVCTNPAAIQCETVDGIAHNLTGETVTCNPQTGFYCQNSAQSDGSCLDYRVRFYCP